MSETAHQHDARDHGPTGVDAVEPDETPDRFLFSLGVGLTVTILITIFFGVWLFDRTLAAEMEAKGYGDAPASVEKPAASH